MPTKGKATSIASRIKGKFRIDPETGCHIWTGSHSSQGKYPTVAEAGTGKPVYVYRAIYEEANGPIPAHDPADFGSRLEIHHRCKNRSCVRLSCLRVLQRRDHIAIHAFERRWNKALSKIAPYGYIPASFAEAA